MLKIRFEISEQFQLAHQFYGWQKCNSCCL